MTTAMPTTTASLTPELTPTGQPDMHSLIARGVLEELVPASPTKPGYLVLSIPGSQYRLHLRPAPGPEAIKTAPGKKIAGIIEGQCRRVDIVTTGGRLVEPVIGRPRRVHGTVIAADPAKGAITVNAGGAAAVDGLPLPFTARLGDARQNPSQFPIGVMVAFDVLDGATFTPVA